MSEPIPSPPSLEHIKHIILVLSGKGGVGKSSVTTQLALSLVIKGYKVGVLDIDLTGPSLPRMFGIEHKQMYQSNKGWTPVFVDGDERLCVVSLGFLIGDRGNSVAWRGPKKTLMISQFITNVCWPEDLDYLIIDTPPGTSDEHILIAEQLQMARPDGAVLVTTPQQVSVNDVKKEMNFCHKVKFRILGVIENMSGFICPYCAECTDIFSSGGGKVFAEQYGIKYLGNLPIDPKFVQLIEDNNKSGHEGLQGLSLDSSEPKKELLVEQYKDSAIHSVFNIILNGILEQKIPLRIVEQ